MNSRFFTFVVVLLVSGMGLVPERTEARQDALPIPISEEEKLRVCSLFNVLKDNAESIQSSDVLMSCDVFFDGVKPEHGRGIFNESSSIIRMTSDFSKRRFAFAARTKAVVMDIEKDGKQEGTSNLAYTIDFDADIYSALLPDGKIEQKEISTTEQFAPGFETRFMTNFGDPRSFGLLGDSLGEPLPGLSEKLSLLARGIGFRSYTKSSTTTDVCITSYEVAEDQIVGRQIISFDLVTSMPIHVRGEDWSKATNSWGILFEQWLEWKEFEGVMVPVRIRDERSSARFDSQGNRHFSVDETEWRFHWISINKKLPSSYFDGTFDSKKPADVNAVGRWLDPEKWGATELVSKGPEKADK